MLTESDAVIMRIFLGETDKYKGQTMYKYIVNMLRAEEIAGATVFRGVMGYGTSFLIHTASILDISEDLPMMVEAMDTKEKIDAFIPKLEGVIPGGHIVLQNVRVVKFDAKT